MSRSDLIGTDTSGAQYPEFNQMQYGLTASGPIVRERLHYFFAAELQQRASTFLAPGPGDSTTAVTEATVLRIRNAIRDRYDFDPGGSAFPDLNNPTGNVFLKLSWHPRPNFSVELSPSYTRSRRDTSSRSLTGGDGWQLSRSGSQSFGTSAGAVLRVNFASGSLTNETVLGFERNHFGIRSDIRAPLFLVQADAANVFASAGSVRGAQGTQTRVSSVQLAENLSWAKGNHTVVVGTQNLLIGVRDNFLGTAWGAWTFDSVDMLEQGIASRYEIALPANSGKPTASYQTFLLSLYGQDHWQKAEHL